MLGAEQTLGTEVENRVSAEKVGSFRLRVQSPCSQPWGSMAGDDRSRHCTRCDLRVHNLSAMSSEAALTLITGPDDRLCVRFNTRADGIVVTGDNWLRRSLRVAGLAVAAIGFWAAVVLVQRPWLALARTLSTPPPAPEFDAARAKRQELERKLAALHDEMLRNERRTMGARSDEERQRIRAEYEQRKQQQQLAKKKPR